MSGFPHGNKAVRFGGAFHTGVLVARRIKGLHFQKVRLPMGLQVHFPVWGPSRQDLGVKTLMASQNARCSVAAVGVFTLTSHC